MPSTGPSSTKPGPIRRALRALGRFFAYIGTVRSTNRASKSKRARRASSNAEFHLASVQLQKLVQSAACFRDSVLLQTLAETGLRRAEICALQVGDIRFEERTLVVRFGKGSKMRVVPMTDSLGACLDRLASKRSGPVFASSAGQSLSLRQVNRIVAKAGQRSGVQNPNPNQRQITCHLIRHSFARNWKSRGGSIETLARIMGHASVKTTWDLYGKESIEDVKRSYRSIMALERSSARRSRNR